MSAVAKYQSKGSMQKYHRNATSNIELIDTILSPAYQLSVFTVDELASHSGVSAIIVDKAVSERRLFSPAGRKRSNEKIWRLSESAKALVMEHLKRKSKQNTVEYAPNVRTIDSIYAMASAIKDRVVSEAEKDAYLSIVNTYLESDNLSDEQKEEILRQIK